MLSKPIRIAIPPIIKHTDGLGVCTMHDLEFRPGGIALCISANVLQGVALSSWNRIDFHGDGVSVIGYKKAEELPLQNAIYCRHLYGRCTLPLLTDPRDNYEMQGRGELNEGLLSTALFHFIATEADKLLGQLAKQTATTKAMKKRKNLEKLHERLMRWVEAKLTNLRGLSVGGDSGGDGKPGKTKSESKPHAPPVYIKIHREKLDICSGVSYPLRVIGFDASKRPVPPGKITWRSKDSSTASISPDNGFLQALAPGLTYITASNDTGLTSAPLIVMVHEAVDITIKSHSPAVVGSNRQLPLQVSVKIGSGRSAPKDTVVLWKTDDERIATVGPDGNLVGGEVGNTQVTAYAGIVESDPLDVAVEKGAAGKPRGGGKGKPRILLSGYDDCPFGEPSSLLDPSDPPIYQRPHKPDYANNIFWINLQHPLAEELLGMGEEKVQWRTYHFQRIVDVYTTLELRNTFGDSQGLDVDHVLLEIQTIAAKLYKEVHDELFDVLFDEETDLATITHSVSHAPVV